MTTAGFRSLADQLRAWPLERLTALLNARPDLTSPTPHDSSQLAARAATRSSIVRALDDLDRCEIAVLDALAACGETSDERLASVVNADAESTRAAVAVLEDRALAWRSGNGLRALTGTADALRGSPGTSGVRAFSTELRTPDEIVALIAEVSPDARAMLEHVDGHGGEARSESARTTVAADDARSPAEELIARRLLAPLGRGMLILPGEVAVALRGGHTTSEPVDVCPDLPTSERDQRRIDQLAAGAAFDLVRRAGLLLDVWSAEPPVILRRGGLGVRDLRATATRLHVDEAEAALLIEVVAAAGLIASVANSDGTPCWTPTDFFDTWVEQPAAERWTTLARAWLRMARVPSRVGQPDPSGTKWNALAPESNDPLGAETRHMTLAALGSLPPGQTVAAGTGGAAILARLAWQRPRRPRHRADHVAATLREAPFLGMTGFDGLASYVRPLLNGDDPVPALAELLPTPIDHVLLQADLTAVAPGPLESDLARRLASAADTESSGGATVYRFTPASVRRAMDLGWTAIDLHDFVASVSRTPVPQPLTYLIDDTARRFGSVRVGPAGGYVRSDDDQVLTELLAHPVADALGLRRLAPTVLISSAPLDVLLARLREIGAAPAVEDAEGVVLVSRPEARRARTPVSSVPHDAVRAPARAAAVASAIHDGDQREASRPGSAETTSATPAGATAVLREAADAGEAVTLSYVDSRGTITDITLTPTTIDAGTLIARDAEGDERRFALSRIRSVGSGGFEAVPEERAKRASRRARR